MLPIARLTVAFGAGLWVGLVLLAPERTTLLLALGLLAAGSLAGWRGALLAWGGLGVLSGSLTAAAQARHCRVQWQPGRQAAILRLHDAPGQRGTTTASVEHEPGGCTGTLRVRFATAVSRTAPTSAAAATAPRGETRPGAGEPLAPAGARLVAVGTYRTGGVFRIEHGRLLPGRVAWRFAARDVVRGRLWRLYGRRAALVEALVLGRRDDIAPALRNQFAAAGLAHLLAISGLHVGILAAWLVLLLRALGAGRGAWLWAAGAVWGYVALLGFPAPATRAAGFLTVYGAARWRQRHPPRGAVLAVAVLVVLAVDHGAVTSVGAWLSVAAVWGTQAGMALLPRRRAKGPWRILAASFGATVATAPITAYAFGMVAPIGLAANLAAIPLAGVIVPAVFASLGLGDLMAGGAGLALAAVERVARWAAAVPGGHLAGAPGVAFSAPWVLVFGAFVWATRQPLAPATIARRLLAATVAGGWGLVAVSGFLASRADRDLTIHVLDVGQGDAIALRTPQRRWVLVDAGPRSATGDAGRGVVVPFLRRRGVERLAAVVVSHGDADHLGGVPAVVRVFDPALVVEPGQPLGTALYLEYLAALDGQGVPWQAARRGDTLVLDSVVIAVLHPTAAWLARGKPVNENSVVLHVRYGCFDALLSGDIGRAAESLLVRDVVPMEVLKVGHHGSAGGTSGPWLDALGARVAVVSVGRNRYGHPAPAVLQRLAERRVPVFRTDRGGTVTIRSDGQYLDVRQGETRTIAERFRCRVLPSSRSSGSSSSRNGCTRAPPVSLPLCSTTSPSLRR